jgi:hypothetical protein
MSLTDFVRHRVWVFEKDTMKVYWLVVIVEGLSDVLLVVSMGPMCLGLLDSKKDYMLDEKLK